MKSPRRRQEISIDNISDYGPSVSRDRRGVLVSHGPGAVVLEDREDISHTLNTAARRPVVRGARRSDALGSLLSEGVITDRQHKAAHRFLDDLSRAHGGSSASFTAIVVQGGSRDGMTPSQQQAIRAVQRVRLMLGLNSDTVFWWVILENRAPAGYDAKYRLKNGTGIKWLRLALDALDDHYHPAGKGVAKS